MLCQLQIKILGNLDLSKAFDQILDLIEKFLHNKTLFTFLSTGCPIIIAQSAVMRVDLTRNMDQRV